MKLLIQCVRQAELLATKPRHAQAPLAEHTSDQSLETQSQNTIQRMVGHGLLVYHSISSADEGLSQAILEDWAQKLCTFKFFSQDFMQRVTGQREWGHSKLTLSLQDVLGSILLVSQITLYGEFKKQRKPSFSKSAPPDLACAIYEQFLRVLRETLGADRVHSGVFGAHMDIRAHLDGPVTFMLETAPLSPKPVNFKKR